MSNLRLSLAIGEYDRVRPLTDGTVTIDGVDPVFLMLEPEEIFFRAFRHQAFDIAELSLSSFCVQQSRGQNPYVGIPVFPSRAFRHSGIYIRKDRGIARPQDLKGRKLGLAEYQLTANIWIRALLADEYGVHPRDVIWVRGGIEEAGRPEKITLDLPPDIRIENAPEGRSLSDMLLAGEIDGIIGPRTPSVFSPDHPEIGWLFDDPRSEALASLKRGGHFPIMHILGLRKSIADQHPWLPGTLAKAFVRAKRVAMERLLDTSASKVMIPFLDQILAETRTTMGDDFWAYGVEPNRRTLDYFLGQHHAQGLSSRRLAVEELFHPGAMELTKI